MNALDVSATLSLVAATGQEHRRVLWPTVVRRAAFQALRMLGRAFASPQVLWWLGLPWQSHRPPSWNGEER